MIQNIDKKERLVNKSTNILNEKFANQMCVFLSDTKQEETI